MMNHSTPSDQAEFVRLLSKHSSQIYGFILMLSVSHSDADDVFQNTSIVLWEKFSSYQPGTSFRAWACRIAYYEVSRLRRDKRKLTYLSDQALATLANSALDMLGSDNDPRETLAECLEKLSATDRKLIEQKYFVRLSTEEIAERSSKSIYAVYRALSRVHGLLLRCVGRQYKAS